MPETIRMFIAAELPPAFVDELVQTTARLRGTLNARYSRRENYHITLAFLGETALTEIPAITRAVDAADGICERVELGNLGFFGKETNATLWCGLDHTRQLKEASAVIREKLDAAGVAYDKKPMRPHITLARKADLTGLPLKEYAPRAVSGIIPAITLFESARRNGILTYTPLYRRCNNTNIQ